MVYSIQLIPEIGTWGSDDVCARIPCTLVSGHEDSNVPTFWLLLYGAQEPRVQVGWDLGLR